MWLKKLKTVSVELMKSAPSGECAEKSAKISPETRRGAPPRAWPCPSLLPVFGFVIGHSPEYRGPPGIVPNG